MKGVALWSGGKDSCFACHKAIQKGFGVTSLLTFMSSEGKSYFHMFNPELLDAQSEAVRIPLVKWKTTLDTYEQEFKKALLQMKAAGAEGVVTGDIYEVPSQPPFWLDRVCGEVNIKPIKPLWDRDTKQLLSDLVNEGFKATVVKVKTDMLGVEWLGREIDEQFLDDIIKLGTIDPCGERGEYHTLVTDGPFFNKSIKILETEKTAQDNYGCLNIKRYAITAKHHNFTKCKGESY